jgi:colicin import membrane protein
MKAGFYFLLIVFCGQAGADALAQDSAPVAQASMTQQLARDAERARINGERNLLEAEFTNQDAACYRTFFVNNCLDEVKGRRREALADLRRQEVSLNEQERKLKGAEQVKKMEEKVSPERQRQDAERRAAALKDFESRLQRGNRKTADQNTARTNEQSNAEANAARVKNNAEKAVSRSTKQASAADEAKKFRERQEKARERQTRHEQDKLLRTKPAAAPLPVPP